MKEKIIRFIKHPVVKYIFFGGLTTLVNFICFYVLTELLHWNVNVSNVISVALSILFAYFVNSRFVFSSQAKGFGQHFSEFVKFVGGRLFTMAVEVGGVYLMVDVLHWNPMLSKLITQVVVLISNYVISKFLVFIKKKPSEKE